MLTQSQTRSHKAGLGLPTTDLTMLLVVLIWGANFSFIKIALLQIPPLAFAALRFVVAAAVMIVILRLREGVIRFPSGRAFWILVGMGVLGSVLYQVFFTLGLSLTTAGNAALLIATSPVMVAIFGALFGIERMTRNIAAGITLAIAGVALVVAARGLELSWQTLYGDLLMLAASGCWAAYTLGVRKLAHGPSALSITTMTMLTGAVGLTLISLPALLRIEWASIAPVAWGGLAYASFLGLIVAYFLWNSSVRLVGGSRTAIYGTGIPLVATLVAWPVLGEQPVPLQAVGAALIVAGVLLTRR